MQENEWTTKEIISGAILGTILCGAMMWWIVFIVRVIEGMIK